MVALLLLGGAAAAEPVLRELGLWPSPQEREEARDQTQERNDRTIPSRGAREACASVAQSFVPARGPLVRVDLLVNNLGDERPGRVRVWRAGPDGRSPAPDAPVFDDVLVLVGPSGLRARSVFPKLEVAAGQRHWLEISSEGRGPIAVAAATAEPDAYPSGRLDLCGGEWTSGPADVWFRTYTRVEREAPAEPVAASAPGLRWTPPERGGRPPSREDYLTRVRSHLDAAREAAERGCGRGSQLYAFFEALLYRQSCEAGACDEGHARSALAMLRRAYDFRFCDPALHPAPDAACPVECEPEAPVNYNWVKEPGFAALWLGRSPSATDEDRDRLRRLLLDAGRRLWEAREGGVMNRSLGHALSFRLLVELYPDAPEAADWRAFAEGVWAEFRAVMDLEDDAAGYAVDHFFPAVLAYARVAGELDGLFADPRFRALVDRFFDQVSPLGVLPAYGDGAGWAHGQAGLVWLFEEAAARTREARYRWLAQRVFEYQERAICSPSPLLDALGPHLYSLAWAALAADESIEPREPAALPSRVTTRRSAHLLPRAEWGQPPRHFAFGEGEVPDKLVLRSGAGGDDLFALVTLSAGFRHGRGAPGALVGLLDRGSVLLGATGFPYWFFAQGDEHESAPLVRRYRGGHHDLARRGDGVRVTRFEDGPTATIAWLEWSDPSGFGVAQERRIQFVKNRFLWIRDRVTFPEAIEAAAGPVFHAGDVRAERGADWFDVYWRVPQTNNFACRNPERYALVAFVPRAGLEARATREAAYLPARGCPVARCGELVPDTCRASPPYVVAQRWLGEAKPGETRWFDTLVIPHGAETAPAALAAGIEVVRDDGAAVSLRLRLPGPQEETWTLADDPASGAVRAPARSAPPEARR
jgi:hypothetical protein